MSRVLNEMLCFLAGFLAATLWFAWPVDNPPSGYTQVKTESDSAQVYILSEGVLMRVSHPDLIGSHCLVWWRQGGVGPGEVYTAKCPRET